MLCLDPGLIPGVQVVPCLLCVQAEREVWSSLVLVMLAIGGGGENVRIGGGFLIGECRNGH